MPGSETKDFDLVIEFAEQALRDLIGVAFDTDGFLCTLIDETLNQLPLVNIECGAFTLDVLFDRPTDIALPGTAVSPVDIRIGLGDSGSVGSMRLVVGLDTDRTGSDFDIVQLNFRDNIYHVEAQLAGVALPAAATDAVRTWLQNRERLPLIPTPVDRATTDPKKIKQADAVIIDDTASADRDALAWCLTFGGGAAGSLSAFTQSFVPDGGRGAIAIFFSWLCRIISPLIVESLDLDADSFSNCKLTKTQTIKDGDGDDVKLTKLELSLKDGFIQVKAAVKKSGTCWTATGSVTARIKIEVTDGRLIVASEVDDPDIDVDIPWYCYLAAAIVGALTGGLFGVVGAIVGAVVGPIIMYIVSELIEGTVQKIADNVVQAINDISPEVDVPAVGINLVFDRVFIDDITILCQVDPIDRAPVRTSGTISLPNGKVFDLDNGKIGDQDLVGGDLKLTGDGDGRKIETVCITELARTGSVRFEQMSRFSLYNQFYQMAMAVPQSELATMVDFGFFDLVLPTYRVYAVRTNEGRYAAIQVVDIEDDFYRIRYKTYEKHLPSVEIQGRFRCLLLRDAPTLSDVEFAPIVAPRSLTEWRQAAADAVLERRHANAGPGISRHVKEARRREVQFKLEPPRERLRDQLLHLAPEAFGVGRWWGSFQSEVEMTGRFDALVDGLKPPMAYHWWVNRVALTSASGQVDVAGLPMRYEVDGGRLRLKATRKSDVTAEIRVAVDDAQGDRAEIARCFKYTPKCVRRSRLIPKWDQYRTAYMKNFGVRELNATRRDKLDAIG